MPETVRQTHATRQAARDFGMASRKGKLIRRAIAPHLDFPPGGSLVNRLNKVLIKSGKDHKAALTGFQWNSRTGTDQFFTQPPTISSDGTLNIPAQSLQTHCQATHLEIKLIATRISFATQQLLHSSITAVMVDLNTPFNGAALHVDISGKGTLLLVLQVRGYKDGVAVNDRKCVAADILAVVPPVATKQLVIKKGRPAISKVLSYQPAKKIRRQPRIKSTSSPG
jgi:hypothetical protein